MRRSVLALAVLLALVSSVGPARGQGDGTHPVITPENADQVEQLAILGFGTIYDVEWSPDSKQIAVASSTGILLYDSEHFDTAPYERLFTPQTLITSVAYSPDGRLLAGMSRPDKWWARYDYNATIHVWDMATNTIRAEWAIELTDSYPQLGFSPDSQTLVIFDASGSANVMWDISALPDVRNLGTQTFDAIMTLWYPPLDLDHIDFPDLTESVMTAASRDHQWVATYDAQGVIHVWNLPQHQEQFTVNLNELGNSGKNGQIPTVTGISFSPKSSLLQVDYYFETGICVGEIGMWDTETGEELVQFSPCRGIGGQSMTLSPDEQRIVMIGPLGFSLSLWDRVTRTTRDVMGNSDSRMGAVGNFAMSLAFSPDSTRLAVARNGMIEIWDVSARARIISLRASESPTNRVVFSADGKLLAVYGWGGAWFYDMRTFQEVASLEADRVYDVSFSSDGRWLAAQVETNEKGLYSSMLTLWDVDAFLDRRHSQLGMENARLVYLYGASMYTDPVSFSPDGTMLAGMGVNEVFVWDVQRSLDAEEIRIETRQNLPAAVIGYLSLNYMPWQITFSPDGRSLAVDNVIYDTETWTKRFELEGHKGTVTSVAFSPGGDLIATSSGSTPGWFFSDSTEPDDTVRLWDAQTGHQLAVLRGHTEGIWQVAFSPDGKLLASGSGASIAEDVSLDGTVRLWGVP